MYTMHSYTVALRIWSPELDPAQITKEVDIAPTQIRAAGEHRGENRVWREAMWELEVRPEGKSDWESLETGLAALLKIVVPRTKAFQKNVRKHAACIWCGHFSSSFDGGPRLSAEMLKSLGKFGVPLWIEAHFVEDQDAQVKSS
jgi:hypothetical protein